VLLSDNRHGGWRNSSCVKIPQLPFLLGAGNGEAVVGLIDKLNLPQLQEVGVAFSTGVWRPEIFRFAVDLPTLVDTLALEGQKLDGEFLSGTFVSPCRSSQ
jgi:hypothetical protein